MALLTRGRLAEIDLVVTDHGEGKWIWFIELWVGGERVSDISGGYYPSHDEAYEAGKARFEALDSDGELTNVISEEK